MRIPHLAYRLAFVAARALIDRASDQKKDALPSPQPMSSPGPATPAGPGLDHPRLPTRAVCSLSSPAREQKGS